MARSPSVPAYSLHKPSGRAVVKVKQRSIYLGEYGSPESRQAYARIAADLMAGCEPTPPQQPGGTLPVRAVTIGEVVNAYARYASGYYRKSGKATSEIAIIDAALRHLGPYRDLPAAAFRVTDMRATQERMASAGLARPTVNKYQNRIVRVFKWAAVEELIPAAVAQALVLLPGLRRGRTTASEPAPILPVDQAVVDATLLELLPAVATMVRLQLKTGMRPGEVVLLRPCDLDRTGEVWLYRPSTHKCEHHGTGRIVFLNAASQTLLTPYLFRTPTEYCFRPERWSPKPVAQRRYDTASYGRSIRRAAERAGVPPWFPNQLRHAFATQVRAAFGLEAAQVLLGHSRADVTQLYAETNAALGAATVRAIE
ncbi:site-specific tyrosine recombinase XerC [Pirellulimonas nuda]|uniref:Site-specific tyrosine recombinase XerC n=1 Tax=Pirellulimonas nuda TaxID=2528009 RepID=A0A518DGA0_9BACT|nr:site-specific integrase [Pirellulimonas nuda]QDU90505.1 site-specific tyrosine recombinase XerC [Pirellulimonas nuda]